MYFFLGHVNNNPFLIREYESLRTLIFDKNSYIFYLILDFWETAAEYRQPLRNRCYRHGMAQALLLAPAPGGSNPLAAPAPVASQYYRTTLYPIIPSRVSAPCSVAGCGRALCLASVAYSPSIPLSRFPAMKNHCCSIISTTCIISACL